jgi:DNA polymerase III subunit chi
MLVQFYHLQRMALEHALPKLMEKALASGLRGVIVCADDEQRAQLDAALWEADAASFVPHGISSAADAASQPLCLSLTADDNPNHASMLVLLHDVMAPISPESLYQRVLDVFDGRDTAALQAARARYKRYKDVGVELHYIQQQEDGSWQKK